MNTIYDVIIVGAGPGGSTVARELATRGVTTLLLDRARFPRDKPCGGGVTIRAARLLSFSLKPVTEQVVSGIRFSFRREHPFGYASARPLVLMTQRCHLDAFLVERAIAAGVRFQDGSPVRAVEIDKLTVTVRTDGAVYRARAVIGADGANGIVARAMGLGGHTLGVAYEGNVPYTSRLQAEWAGTMGLDLGEMPGGYGWLFPKGDHVNVGAGGWPKAVGPRLRDQLTALCRYYRLRDDKVFGLRGHHLPMRRPGTRIVEGPVLLIGDAAGLVDPLSGEGIYSAIRSAQLAVPHILSYLRGTIGALTGYERDIDRLLMPELTASRQLQVIFHHMPAPYVALLRGHPWFWRKLCQLIRGDVTYDRLLARLGPFRRLLDHWAAYTHRRLATVAG